jgi:multiple sugar transport system permease protein
MRVSLPARILAYLMLAVASFCVLFPLIWMFLSALKSQSDIINPNAPLIPTDWHWSNIIDAWTAAPFGRFFINTAIFAVATTAGQVITAMFAGYAFAMFTFPGRRIMFYGVLSGLMIPFTVVLVPVVELLADFGWVDTFQGLIVPNIASALGCFFYRQFFLSAPADLAESARIDGASEWRIFWNIYRPLAQPMTAALTTILFLQNWNNFLFPLVVTSKESLMMISQGLTIFQGQLLGTQYNLLMAGSLIAVIPVLIVAMIAQRRVVDGLMIGATR